MFKDKILKTGQKQSINSEFAPYKTSILIDHNYHSIIITRNSKLRKRKVSPCGKRDLLAKFTSYGTATQWAATTWSRFHVAWVAVSRQTEIRSRKMQDRFAEMGLPCRRTGHYLRVCSCSTDYGTPASLSTDGATLRTKLNSIILLVTASAIGSGAFDTLTLRLDTLRRITSNMLPVYLC